MVDAHIFIVASVVHHCQFAAVLDSADLLPCLCLRFFVRFETLFDVCLAIVYTIGLRCRVLGIKTVWTVHFNV
jgi:hypothetical protein